tara:strand:- start:24 stop:398 length:375 start_codon:yes stop_codon:yes gene_type:complete
MGTCKDDDTCEQSATKGEIESLKSLVLWGLLSIFSLVYFNSGRIQRIDRNTESIREYGTIGANHKGSLRDQQTIRELLDESPASRQYSIRQEKARQWDELMEIAEEKEWLEEQEWYDGTNPYRD